MTPRREGSWPFTRGRLVRTAAAGLVTLLAGCTAHQTDNVGASDRLVDELRRALEEGRPFAPRTSVTVAHAPCIGEESSTTFHTGCSDGHRRPSDVMLSLSATASRMLMREEVSSDALHATGLIDLIWTDTAGRSLDQSIAYLELAALKSQGAASVVGDLSAAHLVRAAKHGEPRDVLVALERSLQSIEADSTDPRAHFNFALGLSGFRLHHEATMAWARALEYETDAEWRDEIAKRARLDSSFLQDTADDAPWSNALVARAGSDPQWGRTTGWDRLLGDWGRMVLAGDSAQAKEALRWADSLGNAVSRAGGDASLRDAAEAVHRARNIRSLALAHVAFARGRQLYEAASYDSALLQLTAAIRHGAESPGLTAWSRLWRGITLAQSGHPDRGLALLRASIIEPRTQPSALRARAQWALATSYIRTERAEHGIALLREARATFSRLGERENIGATLHLETIALVTLGDRERVLRALHEALGNLRHSRRSVRLHNAIYLLAEVAMHSGLPRAAYAAQREGLAVARASRDPLNIAEALIALARIEQRLQDGSAHGTLREAAHVLDSAAEGVGKHWVRADLQLALADAEPVPTSAHAVARLDSAIAFFEGVALPLRFMPARLARSQRRAEIGDTVRARYDLKHVLLVAGQSLRTTHDHGLRATLAGSVQSAIDRLARFELASGRPDRALDVVERGRRLVTPRVEGESWWSQRHGAVIVDYAFIGDSLHVWVSRGDDLRWTALHVTRDSLLASMSQLRVLMERAHETAALAVLADLYDRLFAPIVGALPDSGLVTIVADGEVSAVPFAALYDRRTRAHVIERHAIEFAASRNIAQRERINPRRRGRVVVAADPTFDPAVYAPLTPLPGARAEGDRVAELHAATLLLKGDAATWSTLREQLPGAAVFHFAGHVRFDPADSRATSMLVAAPPTGLRITSDSIATLDLRAMALVVLSSCEAVRTHEGRIGGVVGLAAAFHRAGAERVLGGLWRVEDSRSRSLMEEFHRRFAMSGDPVSALRHATLALLRSSDARLRSPVTWAAFQLVRG